MSKFVILLVISIAMCIKAAPKADPGFLDFEEISRRFAREFPSFDDIKEPIAPILPLGPQEPDTVRDVDGADAGQSGDDNNSPRFPREFPSFGDFKLPLAPKDVRPVKSAEAIKDLEGAPGKDVHGSFHSHSSHKHTVNGKVVENEEHGRDVTNDNDKIKESSY